MAQGSPSNIMAELRYQNPRAALDWLAAAFGCSARMIVSNPAGQLVYAEIGWGAGLIAVVPEQPPRLRSPMAVEGANTQSLRIRLDDGIDAHCDQARAAGAVIEQQPMTHFFGDRTYAAADLEGHLWTFSQRVSDASVPPPEGWSVVFPEAEA